MWRKALCVFVCVCVCVCMTERERERERERVCTFHESRHKHSPAAMHGLRKYAVARAVRTDVVAVSRAAGPARLPRANGPERRKGCSVSLWRYAPALTRDLRTCVWCLGLVPRGCLVVDAQVCVHISDQKFLALEQRFLAKRGLPRRMSISRRLSQS
jgi:hypothetical protein